MTASRGEVLGVGWPPVLGTSRTDGRPSVDVAPGLPAGSTVHLIGIAGAGMSGLARLMAGRGLRVSGSDLHGGPAVVGLRRQGITVHRGHDAEHLPEDCALVVRSPAIPDDNPEITTARRRNIPITKPAPLLGALMDTLQAIAIAGTHGKTTTAGWVAHVLIRAGLQPTFLVGAPLVDHGTNAACGDPTSPWLVVEADEYDRTFLHYRPLIGVITNVEHDHPDIFEASEDVEAVFAEFASHVPADGRLVIWAGTPSVARLARATSAAVATYALETDDVAPDSLRPTWLATERAVEAGGQRFDVLRDGAPYGRFRIQLHGIHNLWNALAVIACAHEAGVPAGMIAEGLASYRGVGRRMQVLGHAAGVTVVDDYAHHPTEIAVTVAGAKEAFPDAGIWAVAQPHTFSRVLALGPDYADALRGADHAIVTPIFGARERQEDFPDASPDLIADALPNIRLASDLTDAAQHVAEGAQAGDVALFMGAGDVPRASRECLALLRRRDLADLRAAAERMELAHQITEERRLAGYTSLRVGGPADLLVTVRDVGDMVTWVRWARERRIPVRVLGRGTNVLIGDDGVEGLVIVNRCETWEVTPDGERESGDEGLKLPGTAVLRAESGVTLAALGHSLARRGWSGLEAAVGIPGSVGGAVVTNAGAHGWEMADDLLRVEILGPDGRRRWWTPDALDLGYRTSALRGDPTHVILHVELRVRREDPAVLRERIASYSAHRKRTQPRTPSVGSMFRNPEGDFAGRLIDEAGLKGTTEGGAQVSPKHANFFVNRGGATASDFRSLIARAADRVRDRFDVNLVLEIEQMGRDVDD